MQVIEKDERGHVGFAAEAWRTDGGMDSWEGAASPLPPAFGLWSLSSRVGTETQLLNDFPVFW